MSSIPGDRFVSRRDTRSIACLALVAGACVQPPPAPLPDVAPASVAAYDPSRDLGPLFHDAQMARVYPDSKTLVDAHPIEAPADIARLYETERSAVGFDIAAFVRRHFMAPGQMDARVHSDTAAAMEAHIKALWPMLTRSADRADSRSTLIPLPYSYVVPGGRFREVYYWDSYFTMLGLIESGRTDLVKNMLDNFAHLVTTVGHIPNGNRSYYLSRSQPPFFAAMVGLYATATDTAQALPYLPALEAEYAFWMDGVDRVRAGEAYRRVVRLADGTPLNRYWDDRADPRPESYREDELLGERVAPGQRAALYRNVRASAESGWDFSSRWMRDPSDLRTLETTSLAPVDLNTLLYHAERTIAALRRVRRNAGDADVARRFEALADARRAALQRVSYDPATGFFYDVRWASGERVTDRPTLAAAVPLYFGVATAEQGRAVSARLERDFLRVGGFTTTAVTSGQQWDAPNGWAPLQWMATEGARRYGRADLADDAQHRWLALNRRTFRSTGKMTEKYDVLNPNRAAGGGEYPTQDGFGWSNGVALAMEARERAAPRKAVVPTP